MLELWITVGIHSLHKDFTSSSHPVSEQETHSGFVFGSVFFASAFRIVWCPSAEDLCYVNSVACCTVTVQITDFKNMVYWGFSILKVASPFQAFDGIHFATRFSLLIRLTNLTFRFVSFCFHMSEINKGTFWEIHMFVLLLTVRWTQPQCWHGP